CKKQTVVANSTTEVEYVAASSCCGQVLWIQNQLLDYRDSNEKKLIQMIKIHTDKNVLDLLTKTFNKGIGVNAGDSKLMLLGINLLLLGKFNAARHNLLLLVATVKVKTVNGEVQLQALVDGKKVIITETIEEVINEENVPTHSNDPLLSGEDRLKLEELMELCTNLQNRVGLSARVISSKDEGLDEEYASKQGRKIHDIDVDEDITLENVHDEDMFDTGVFNNEEVFAGHDMAEKEVSIVDPVNTAGEVVTTTNVEVSTASPTAATITTIELTLAQTLAELKSARPKTKWVVMHEPSETTTTTIPSKYKGKGIMDKVETDYELAQRLQVEEQEELTIQEKSKLFQQLLEKRRRHFVAKRAEERRNRPPIKAQQRSIMCTYLKNMAGWKPKDLKTKSFANVQELFDKAMKRVNTFIDMDTELVENNEQKLDEKVEAEVDDAKEAEELKQCLEIVLDDGDDVTIDATPLFVKIPIINEF
ncbi:hypothetical protein Tco_0905954, partial [Tanacetum coccineum]